jgi:hypothetical protein
MIFIHWEEAPREVVEGLGLWLSGLVAGGLWAHHKIVRPERERHQELLQKHNEQREHLKKIEEKVDKTG